MLEPTITWFKERGVAAQGFAIAEVEHQPVSIPSPARALILTSANAVACLPPTRLPIYAVGKMTAERATEAGFSIVHTGKSNAAALAQELLAFGDLPQTLFHPHGNLARVDWHQQLEQEGYTVYATRAYTTSYTSEPTPELTAAMVAGSLAAVALYSPGGARAWQQIVRKNAPGGAAIPVLAFSSAVAEAANFAHTIYTCENPTNEDLLNLWHEHIQTR